MKSLKQVMLEYLENRYDKDYRAMLDNEAKDIPENLFERRKMALDSLELHDNFVKKYSYAWTVDETIAVVILLIHVLLMILLSSWPYAFKAVGLMVSIYWIFSAVLMFRRQFYFKGVIKIFIAGTLTFLQNYSN